MYCKIRKNNNAYPITDEEELEHIHSRSKINVIL